MKNFKALPHRSAFVRKIKDVTFINDSKATNMDSALKSIITYDSIRWIVGGQKKDGDKVNPIHFFYQDITAEEYEVLVQLASIENQSL